MKNKIEQAITDFVKGDNKYKDFQRQGIADRFYTEIEAIRRKGTVLNWEVSITVFSMIYDTIRTNKCNKQCRNIKLKMTKN